MKILSGVAVLCLMVAGGVAAHAQNLPEPQVEELSKIAHKALPDAMTGKGEIIGKEKAATLVFPLIPYKEREETIVRGHISGYAKWCGLKWDDLFFVPYMTKMRTEHKDWNDYQFAYVGLLHGLSMSLAEKSKDGETCTPEEKQKLAAMGAQ